MKNLIVILAIVLLPATAWGWRDNYYDSDREFRDAQLNYQLQRIVEELEYQQRYHEYEDQVREYEEAYPDDLQQFMLQHYYKWPTPPKR